ncbi:MAG: amino acid adenylation domain-containing protein [Candidatus Thiodiazotropha sp.]
MSEDYALTSVQQVIWMDQMLSHQSPCYNLGAILKIEGPFDKNVLNAAFSDVVNANDALRIVIRSEGNTVRQYVEPNVNVELECVDFSDGADARGHARDHILSLFNAPFKLEGGLLWNAQLVRESETLVYMVNCYHHIIVDGTSVSLICQAIADRYNQYLKNESHDQYSGVSYLKFLRDDQKYLSSSRYEQDAGYWQSRFAIMPSLLFSPSDKSNHVFTNSDSKVLLTIKRIRYRELKALSHKFGCTITHAMTAILVLYFARVSRLDEVVIGMPVHNRSGAHRKRAIGVFASVIPLGVSVDVQMSFDQLMNRVAGEMRRCYRHQRFPIADINRLLRLAQSGRRQLFDVIFSFEEFPVNLNLGETKINVRAIRHRFEQTTLAMHLQDYHLDGDVVMEFNYDPDLLERPLVEDMCQRIDLLISAVLKEGGGCPVGHLSWLRNEERQQVLYGWNATAVDYPKERFFHTLFEQYAKDRPQTIALVEGDTEFSYEVLNQQANRLAHYLRKQGVVPDSLVAICMGRCASMVVSLLATLKAGGGYMPLDPSYPQERLAYMLEDSKPLILLMDSVGERALRDVFLTGYCVNVQTAAALWEGLPADNLSPERVGLRPRHLAYVIYTSGSTGRPKGVMVEHRNLNGLITKAAVFGVQPGDRILQFASLSFDASVGELVMALCNGGCLCLAEREALVPGDALLDTLSQLRVTHIILPPSAMVLCKPEYLPSCVKTVISGGEVLAVRTARSWAKHVGLINAYGPTEITLFATSQLCGPDSSDPVPIGRPVANARIYILDRECQPVPVGGEGEIYIGGDGVVRGYLNRPGLTSERFLPDPFQGHTKCRIYKTGDLGRWCEDGSIEFLGRNDQQVKIRGFRIELGEVEAVLAKVEGVDEAVVAAREDGEAGPRLVAYYLGDEGLEVETLRSTAVHCLPAYMVPSAYVRLSELPLTPNGKLDRRSLPAPEEEAYGERTYEPPQGELETNLARHWSELLQVSQIGRRDNFFELGGHSLLAVKLASRLHAEGLVMDIGTLYRTPTLFELAAHTCCMNEISEAPPNRVPEGADAITPEMLSMVSMSQVSIDRIVKQVAGGAANVADIYPLGPLQEGILFHSLTSQGQDPYLLSARLGFTQRAALDRFLNALQRVIDRHDVLRTSFFWDGLEEPVQVVWRQARLPVAFVASATEMACLDIGEAPLLRCLVSEVTGHWVLTLLVHHLVMDHTALDVLLEETWALEHDEGVDLPAPVPYRDYVAQARLGLSQEAHEAFFSELLGDIDEPTAPFGLLDVQGDGGGLSEFRQALSPSLAMAIRVQARRLGVSAASIAHLAWGLVLSRTTGRASVVFGTVLFGRMHGGKEAERGLGLFINTLPLRIDVDDRGVEASLKALHGLLLELLRHEHAPLTLAQHCSGLAGQTPLFSSLLNYRYSAPETLETDVGREVELLEAVERTNYPVNLSVDDLGEGFVLTAQVLAPVNAQRLCAYMEQALEQLVLALASGSTEGVAELDILPQAERHRLLYEWNATQRDYPKDQSVPQLLEQWAMLTPDALAVIEGDRHLTYRALNESANRLAHAMIAVGVGPGDRVALALPRSSELIVAELAVLKAGALYVPLDDALPPVRRAFILNDSEAKLVVTRQAHELPGIDRQPLCIALESLDLGSYPKQAPAVSVGGETGACVMYTSGSTGTPKGVVITQRGIVRLVINNGFLDFRENERVAVSANPAFDASTLEVWGALLNGSVAVVVDADTFLDAFRLAALIEAQEIRVLFLTTALFNQYSQVIPQTLGGLRCLLSGGERADVAAFARLRALGGPQYLFNGYGPTEVTTLALTHCVVAVEPGSDTIPIGRPIGNTTAYLLDERLRPVPIGVAGELYLGGAGVAQGYLNRPALTAEHFLENPFQPNDRVYRTGDLCRWQDDGIMEFLGRNDDQVKIRGFRIEPGEVEAVLCAVAGVSEVAVVVRGKETNAPHLVAYYTGDPSLAVEMLRLEASQRLPGYMVPVAYLWLEALPLTPNGKRDLSALPAPDEVSDGVRDYEAPQGALERRLAQLWQELLQVKRVGRRDNFFELGGHSLLAVRLVSRLRGEGLAVAIGALFEHPELAELAACLDAASIPPRAAIPAVDRSGPLPLSPMQQRLWFLTQMEGASQAYHISGAISLRGRLDRGVLQRALQRIVERHEILRTRFVWLGGEGAQIVRDGAEPRFEYHELDGEREARRLSARHAGASFDLTLDPPLRVLLIRLREEEHVLQVVLQHIASDGWSVGRFLDELSQLYQAFLNDQADPLPTLPIQYGDYAVWQRERLSPAVMEAESRFWREQLKGVPVRLELPWDRPRPVQQCYEGASLSVRLEEGLSERLRALCRRQGVTLYMALLASWGALLGRLSGQDEVVIGSPVAGRNQEEVEPLIGFFVNTLAMRIDLKGEPDVTQLLLRVKEAVLSAQAHQDLPFDQVVEVLKPPRSTAYAPFFQVMFAWQSELTGELKLPNVTVESWEVPVNTAQYDLTLSLEERAGGIEGSLNYATALFDQETVERYLRYWQHGLEALVADEQAMVARLPLMSPQEGRQLLYELSGAERDSLKKTSSVQAFERWAHRTPDVVAVIDGDRRLTYQALDEKANRLSHAMIAGGVVPGDRVGVALPRSIELVIAELAVLKAGAAYVPLDDLLPEARQIFMLEDSQAKLLLTKSDKVLPATRQPLNRIDLDRVDLSPYSGMLPAVMSDSEAPAYIMYTSGSTGTPKGVVTPQAGVVRLVIDNGYLDFRQEERVGFAATPAFDASTFEVWGALLNGGALVVVDADTLLEASRLAALIETRKIGVMFFTTSLFNQYTLEIPQALCRLRCLLCGGERADAAAFARLLKSDAPPRLLNCYGPTESTTFALTHTVEAVEEGDVTIPIGRPIGNTRVYLLDEFLQPVPVGVAGELYIGGAGVALGYLNRPELTAERFLEDPFQPGGRLYRTGDLGRWRSDGSVDYLGRTDQQVKIRGFRIEPGEIESVLVEAEGVREAAVVVRGASDNSPALVAYYTGSEQLDVATLRQIVAQRLPSYMVPSAYVWLSALPLTINGKLDQRRLPKPMDEAYATHTYEPPQGEIETALARLWCELLDRERIGRQHDFFELGGHSLLAVRMISRLQDDFDLEVHLRELFSNPTLAAFAKRVTRTGGDALASNLTVFRNTGSSAPLFFIHEGSGGIGFVRALLPGIDAEIPVYGLSAIGQLSDEQPLESVEAMAAVYLQAVRPIQPTGPYRFAGWSFGGKVAFEMARQLLAVDERVEFLGMLDTYFAAPFDVTPSALYYLQYLLRYLLPEGCEPADELSKRLQKLSSVGDTQGMLRACQEDGLFPADVTLDTLERHFATGRAIFHANIDYVPPRLPVTVSYFEASEEQRGAIDWWKGWTTVSDRTVRIPVSGTHRTMVEPPYAEGLGGRISLEISRVSEDPG